MLKLTCLLVIACVFITRSNGQWPLGQSFYSGMNRMMSNVNSMATDMAIANQQRANQRQAIIQEDIMRSWHGVPFGTGGSVFITYDGGLGYAYNSTDGSFTLYSLRAGSPPSGYMYHIRQRGGTTFNSW